MKLKGDVPDAAWNIVMAGVEGAPAARTAAATTRAASRS